MTGPDDVFEARTEQVDQEDLPSFLDQLRSALVDTHGLDDISDPQPLIGEDIMFRDSLVWLVGKPGSFKSFVGLDIAGCVGTGEPWQGYEVHQGLALYIIAEGVRGTKKRVRAWEKAAGRAMDGVKFLPIAVQSKVPEQWAALVTLARELKPTVIVLDTQARVTVGVEENSNTEMGEFVDQAERLRRACGACVIIIHHIGRNGDTGRGATTLDGAMSTIAKVTKDELRVTLECQKNKDGPEWDEIALRAVSMGDSIVLMPDDGTSRPSGDLRARKWVHDWWRVHGEEPVSVNVLVKSGVITEPTFHRTKRDLLEQGIVTKEGAGRAIRYRLAIDPTLG